MRKQIFTVIVACLLGIVLVLYLFTFQVSARETKIVLTFGEPTRTILQPGLYWCLPQPFQKVESYSRLVQIFDDSMAETLTHDRKNVIVTGCVGWRIAEGKVQTPSGPKDGALYFRERVSTPENAQNKLVSLISDRKNDVIGKYDLRNFISVDPTEMKFAWIEKDILEAVRPEALREYGIEVVLFRIKRLELPENAKQAVYGRMKDERQAQINAYQSEGEAKASEITSQADLYREKIITDAKAEAARIRGEGEAEVAKYSEVFKQRPELAVWLRAIRALESISKKRTTIVLTDKDSLIEPITRDLDMSKLSGVKSANDKAPVATEGR